MDLDQVDRQLLAGAQRAQRLGDLLGRRDQHVGHRDGLLHRRLDRVQPEVVGGLLGVVDDVVERRGQVVDVGRLERRPLAGALVQPVDDVVGDAVALLLALEDLAREVGAAVGEAVEHVAQQRARARDVRAGLLEKVVETSVRPAAEQLQAGLETPLSSDSSTGTGSGRAGSPSGPSAWKR